MTITSFSFLVFVAAGVMVYYIIPKGWQWAELLALSLVFYYFSAVPYTIAYLVISTAVVYGATMLLRRMRGCPESRQALLLTVTFIAIAVNLGIWFFLKGRELWAFFLVRIQGHMVLPQVDALLDLRLVSALGMGYYTLQVLGYLIDCCWGNAEPQKNPLKLFLFVAYFPQLMTGPISRYGQLEILYDKHRFQYRNLAFGAQRILWGFVKKLVLAERVGALVSGIAGRQDCTGFYAWVVILLYPLQMYADFSGCMDIVLGVSELFDIRLSENFRNPFFARTSQEFWQRWHITLGTWAKDYVLYPILKSTPMIRFGKVCRKRFGKKAGKFLVNVAGMFLLWMVMGIWHGGPRHIVGVGLWYWVVLMLGDLLGPVFAKVTKSLSVKTESFSWRLFQAGRTYLVYAVGAAFFGWGIRRGGVLLREAWKVISVRDYANPWIFFDGSLLISGMTYGDVNLILLVVLMLVAVAYLREKYGYARIWIQRQGFVFRWSVWLGLFALVLIYGKYGPGYSAAEFIYQGF